MKKFSRLAILLGLGLLTIVGLLRLAKVEVSLETLERVNWGWIGLTVLVFFSTILVRGSRWHRILQAMGHHTPFLYANTLLIAGLFISAILPARLGDVGRVALLKQDYHIPVSKGLASIAAERALDVFTILLLALICSVWALSGRIPWEFYQLMLISGSLFLVGLVGLLAIPSLETWLRQPFGWHPPAEPEIATPSRRHTLWRFYQQALDFGFSLIRSVRELGRQPLALTIALIESVGIWFGDGLLIYLCLVSIGAIPSLSLSVFAVMISDLIAAVPLTPGAIGQFDGTLYGILVLAGVKEADAGLGVVLLRLLSLWTLIPVSGLITYLFGFSRALNLTPASLNSGDPALNPTVPSPIEG